MARALFALPCPVARAVQLEPFPLSPLLCPVPANPNCSDTCNLYHSFKPTDEFLLVVPMVSMHS